MSPAAESCAPEPDGGSEPPAAFAFAGLAPAFFAEVPALLVLLSDGKANVPLPDVAGDPWQQCLEAAARLADAGTPVLVLDAEVGFVRLGRARQLAQALRAKYMTLEHLSAEELVVKVRGG